VAMQFLFLDLYAKKEICPMNNFRTFFNLFLL